MEMFALNAPIMGYAPAAMTPMGMEYGQTYAAMQAPGCPPLPGGPNWDPGIVNPFSVGDPCCVPPIAHEQKVAVIEKCPSPHVHVVRPGDTLYKIAQKYGRDWRELAGYNHLSNPDLIYPGQHILIPRC